jgi:periplasmic copper chaperone A
MSLLHLRWLRAALIATVVALSAGSLTACGNDDPAAGATSASPAITAADPWVKAVDSGMTAAFVTLTNASDSDLVLVSASTPASSMVELHEMTMKDGEMVMQPKEGGIPLPADGTATLEPGGDHIMLMDVTEPIQPGDLVSLTLTFDDGSTLDVDAVAKEFSGADEDYSGGDSMG